VVTAAPAGFYGASWGEDGTIVFDTAFAGRGLMEVEASGGVAVPVSLPDGNRRAVQWFPQILPGSEAILCLDFARSWEEPSIAAFSRRDRDWKPVYTTGAVNGSARYVGSGHLMFSAPEALMAARFDPVSLAVLGPPARVMEGALGTDFRHHFDLTNGGTLVFIPGNAGEDINRPVWVDRKGNVTPLPVAAGAFAEPELSPDGRFLVLADNRVLRIWVYDLVRGGRTALTSEPSSLATWSPDGNEVLYASLSEPRLLRKNPFRSEEPRLVVAREYSSWPTTWSGEGSVGFYEQHPETGRDVWVQPLGGEPFLIAGTPASELAPRFSPDSRFLAYASDESGRHEIYVVPYSPTGIRYLVSTGGGEEPVWSHDGRELFYRHGDRMFVVDIETRPSFTVSPPRVLFEGRFEYTTGGHSQNYDVAPDGRFLMIQRVESARLTEIRVVVGFDRELERLVPAP
jgi:Tol biopolymer transport system component